MKKNNDNFTFGIRSKLFFLVLIGFSVLIFFTSWRIGVEANRAATTAIDRTLDQSSQILRTKLVSRFETVQETARSLAKDGRVLPLVFDVDSATLQDLSLEFKKALAFDVLFFTDKEGVVLARSDRPDAIGQSLRGKSALFDNALKGQTTQGIIVSQDKLLQIVVVPVLDNVASDVVRGTLAIAYELSPEIAREINALTASDIGFFAFIRDANRNITGVKSSYNTNDKLNEWLTNYFAQNSESWNSIYNTKETQLHFSMTLNDDDFFAIAVPLANFDGENLGFIMALTSRTELMMPFIKVQQQVYVIGFLCLLVASLLAWIIAIRITKPIVKLVSVAKKIQDGQFPDTDMRIDIHDEVDLLQDAIIKMGKTLKEKADLEGYLAQLSDDIDLINVDLPASIQLEIESTSLRNTTAEDKTLEGDDASIYDSQVIQDTQFKDKLIGDTSPNAARKSNNTNAAVLTEGMLVNERYDVIKHLGAGAMADVYLANDRELGELLALKILHDNVFTQGNSEFFKEEIRLARRITHRNIVRTYDFGVWNGRYLITMEYVHGFDVAKLLDKTGAMTVSNGLAMARQICAAIKAAHDQGIIHRDLKPSNMMINKQGIIKIMDFGLAMNIHAIKGSEGNRMGNVIAGTPKYMAPEQFAGGQLDQRTDIYALGLILYAIFSGKPPFDEVRTFEDLEKMHLNIVPTSLKKLVKDIPDYLAVVIHKAIAKNPADRYQSVGELLEDLYAI
ncbi:MAG: protein kinase [Pseudomonadota bacterium]